MSFPVSPSSRRVLLPVHLFRRDGSPLEGALPVIGSVSTMVVGLSGDGKVFQELHPLVVKRDASGPFEGASFELRSLPAGAGYHAYYLGVPDIWFTPNAQGNAKVKALSFEVMGTPSLGTDSGFNGGVDLHIEEAMPVPPVMVYLQLLERYFPDFWQGLEMGDARLLRDGQGHPVLWIRARLMPLKPLPPALNRYFSPRFYQDAVVEGLSSEGGMDPYWIVQGGCFRDARGRFSHWFGRNFGPRNAGARVRAGVVADAVDTGEGPGWFFWLEPRGSETEKTDLVAGSKGLKLAMAPALRHAALHQALSRGFPGRDLKKGQQTVSSEVLAGLRALEALAALWRAHLGAIRAYRHGPPASEWHSISEGAARALAQSTDQLAWGHAVDDLLFRQREGLRVLERVQEVDWESAALRHPVDRLLRHFAKRPQSAERSS